MNSNSVRNNRRGHKAQQKSQQNSHVNAAGNKRVEQDEEEKKPAGKNLLKERKVVALEMALGRYDTRSKCLKIVFEKLPELSDSLTAEEKQQLSVLVQKNTKLQKETFEGIITIHGGVEYYIVKQSAKVLCQDLFLIAKMKGQVSELTFNEMDDLIPEHLEFISQCCEEKKGALKLTIIGCPNVNYSHLSVFDEVNVDMEMKKG